LEEIIEGNEDSNLDIDSEDNIRSLYFII